MRGIPAAGASRRRADWTVMWGSARVRLLPATVALWACLASAASACTIPVFRYALDRWEADPYRLVVPASWATDRDAVKLLVPLRGNGVANVRVEERDDPALDRARLLFPRDDTPLWEGRLDAATLESLLESPARRGVLERLLAGDSVVWVVVARKSDAADVDRIAGRLRFVEQVAELPVQDPNDPDSRLGPGPPLRLKFSVVEVSLDDPAERMFLRMLAGPGHEDLVQRGSPFAAPVFGRGRVLGVWPLEELDDATLEDTSLFLTGRCSCRLKDGNPGWDLLLRVDWERALAAASSHDEAVSAGPPDAPASGAGERAVETVAIVADDSRPARARFAPSGALFGGLGLAVLAALAGWRLWRAR